MVLGAQLYKVLDPRSPLGKMRRRQLQTVCETRKIQFSPDEGAEVLRQRLQQAGITGSEPGMLDGAGNPIVPQARLSTENPDKLDYSLLKMPELRKLCKQREIPQNNKDTKASLVEKLNGQEFAARR